MANCFFIPMSNKLEIAQEKEDAFQRNDSGRRHFYQGRGEPEIHPRKTVKLLEERELRIERRSDAGAEDSG